MGFHASESVYRDCGGVAAVSEQQPFFTQIALWRDPDFEEVLIARLSFATRHFHSVNLRSTLPFMNAPRGAARLKSLIKP
jgi:hypothetical protein